MFFPQQPGDVCAHLQPELQQAWPCDTWKTFQSQRQGCENRTQDTTLGTFREQGTLYAFSFIAHTTQHMCRYPHFIDGETEMLTV